jgi:hypothetical protein
VVRSRQVERSEDSDEYYFDAGTTTFTVNSAAYSALISGKRYCIYYLPTRDIVLSIEPVELAAH